MIVEINDEGKHYVLKIEWPEHAPDDEFGKLVDKSDSADELLNYLEAKGYIVEEFNDFCSINF